ncbi:F-box/kelch-repeat protein [Raphanus sativus]|nr:F-box/kelch-repeat protein [Raphanus sativus]
MCSASNPEQPPPQKKNHLLSLPEDIILSCLARVPRNCNLNVAQVSKTLRTFVTSPELNRMRSLLHKSSLYVCFDKINQFGKSTNRCLTLEKTSNEYRLVLFPCQRQLFMDHYLAVSVGSDIYLLSKYFQYPSNFWILDTRSGKLSQGPNMKVELRDETMGVIDGKIYVMGFDRLDEVYQKIQVHVFDPK